MGLLSRIQQLLTSINHLGVGDEQDPALPHYDLGSLHGRQVRQARPMVTGFNHAEVDCATGIIEREGTDNNPGLRGITGCWSDRGVSYHPDGYRTFEYGAESMAAYLCRVKQDPINVNDTITLDCEGAALGYFYAGFSNETIEEWAKRGQLPDGACHPDNVKKKLNEFAAIERQRCYPNSVVPGFEHPPIDCATGIIEREGTGNNPGLRGITGCWSDRGISYGDDAYRTSFLWQTLLSTRGCKVKQDPIHVNNTITLECAYWSSGIDYGGFSQETLEEWARRGRIDGECHPNNVQKKLNEFAAIERERCYPRPNAQGYDYPEVDCLTGTVKRLGKNNNPGLRGITGCWSDRTGSFDDDAYETSSSADHYLSSKGCRVSQNPIHINDQITMECSAHAQGIVFEGYPLETVEEYARRGRPDGECHPNNVQKKLNEFLSQERARCYPDSHPSMTPKVPTASSGSNSVPQVPTVASGSNPIPLTPALPTGTNHHTPHEMPTAGFTTPNERVFSVVPNVTNRTTLPTTVDTTDLIPSADAPSNLGYLGFLVAPIGLGIVVASLGVYAAYRWWTRSEKPEPKEPREMLSMLDIEVERDIDTPYVLVPQDEEVIEVSIPD